MSKPKIAETCLRVADDAALCLAVLADTHSALHPAMAGRLASLRPGAILHAGDIGDPTIVDRLAVIAPVLAVRGNIDTRASGLPDAWILDVVSTRRCLQRILLVHIALRGASLLPEAVRLARSRSASLVVCGHSHVPFVAQEGDLWVFNPGSAGPRRFHLPIVFGTVEIDHHTLRLAHVDCATGEPWRPPGNSSSGAALRPSRPGPPGSRASGVMRASPRVRPR